MPDRTLPSGATARPPSPHSDIGRRVEHRRGEPGRTPQEAAERAGTAPGYIQYLEEQPTAAPGVGLLVGLVDALDTTVAALRGGDVTWQVGRHTRRRSRRGGR